MYDLGRDGDGTLYFTMKRVRGVTFEHIIDALKAGDEEAARQFTRRKLLGPFANVCPAVDFAHARGVVHRDLKPGNVMLGDFGEVYVLDWGLPPSYVFRDGGVQLVPAMLDLPPVQTHAFLLFASMSLVVTSSVIMGRFRETITRNENKMHVQAWQLQQLVPEQARPASAVAGTSDASNAAS